MEELLDDILENKAAPALIFVLGSGPRRYFEEELLLKNKKNPSIYGVANIKKRIKVMFLDKLQYLFMYLTMFEVDCPGTFENLVILGLDTLLSCEAGKSLSTKQTRLASLIYNIAFRVMERHSIHVQFVPYLVPVHNELVNLEVYWSRIGSNQGK